MDAALAAEDGVRTLVAQMRYLADDSPVNRRFVSPGAERSTGNYTDTPVTIRDGRTIRDHFSLDLQGFALFDHRSALTDFEDSASIEGVYLNEAAEFVSRTVGATHVVPRGWMLRTAADLSHIRRKVAGYQHRGGTQPPAGEAHVDYSPHSAYKVADETYRANFPGGPGYRRFIAFSFWRALSPPPQNCPLAVCDGRSLADDEGVLNPLHIVDDMPSEQEMLADIPGEDNRIAANIFRYQPEHRWWYFSNMTAEEALLFKFFDSDHSVTWRCPHSAFFDTSLPGAQVRKSIETRLLAFFE